MKTQTTEKNKNDFLFMGKPMTAIETTGDFFVIGQIKSNPNLLPDEWEIEVDYGLSNAV